MAYGEKFNYIPEAFTTVSSEMSNHVKTLSNTYTTDFN